MYTVGVATIELHIPGNGSLKGKRAVIRPIISRLRNQCNVSVAEVDAQDMYQRAVLAVSCVSADAGYAHALLMKVVEAVENMRHDAEVVDYTIELL